MKIIPAVTLLSVYTLGVLFTEASADFQCSFQSCPTRDVQLTEGDPPVTLPCDFNMPINSSTTAGNYTYCYNSTILVPHSNSSYTIENIDYTLDNSKICCFDNEAQSCAVCYNFSVYYKPRNRFKFLQGPTPVFGEQFTINCEVIANPSPVCQWRRTMFQLGQPSADDNGDDGSSSSTSYAFPTIEIVDVPIPSEAIFTNNNCTITLNTLKPSHEGDYSCTATNFLGIARASIPTITFAECNSRSTQIDYTGPSVVSTSINSTVTFTCSAGSASPLTIINFYFNNTLYLDPNNVGTLFDVGIVVKSTFNQDDCSIQSTLTIQQFSEQFVGQYSCSVSIFTTTMEGDNETFSLEVATPEEDVVLVAISDDDDDDDTNEGLLIGVPLGVFILLASLITVFILLLVLIRSRLMTSILRLPPPPYSPDLYQYDVFISHTQDTDDYVNTVLKKGLEGKGYRVQTPVDFVAGHVSDENIINTFKYSRYVMILFSAAYDHNCSELQYAYNKVDETKYNCLIPVKCGGVIPAKLERITYADYDNDDVVSRVEQTIGTPLYGV
ncbi:uncharacterized protein [Dysidea avara]|uniref:uncharacterized protein n=1 Tax=Dysidea avara TaxID=196820 RepID=UPI00332FD0AB